MSDLPETRFRVAKKTGGWWYVHEMAVGTGRLKAAVLSKCSTLNADRLESKRVEAQMAAKEYRQAKKSYRPDPEVRLMKRTGEHGKQ